MDKTVKLPYPEGAAQMFPSGKTPRKMKIIRCSLRQGEDAWYKDMVGQTITVHYFATFGVWDTEGRWLDYYDLQFVNP